MSIDNLAAEAMPSTSTPPLRMPRGQRLAMVACGYIPVLNLAVMIGWMATCWTTSIADGWAWLSIAWLLVIPPLVVRMTLVLSPLPAMPIPLASRAFLVWWFTSQWQTIFNRLPLIEEGLRLVPGAYSAWLRLWGARVGRFVYWTPGLRILDRSLLAIGDRVVFGIDVRLNPHLILRGPAGDARLIVAAVRIGSDAFVGGYSLLLPGAWIGDGEASPGRREFRPFSGWTNGKRVPPPDEVGEDADG